MYSRLIFNLGNYTAKPLCLFPKSLGRTTTKRYRSNREPRTVCAEVLNRKAYWMSERRPYKRNLLKFINMNPYTQTFSELLSIYVDALSSYKSKRQRITQSGHFNDNQSLSSENNLHSQAPLHYTLTTFGPLTAFIPTNKALAQIDERSLKELKERPTYLEYFLGCHIVEGYWLYRDLIGSTYQPWKERNTPRRQPESITAVNNENIVIKLENEIFPHVKNCTIAGASVLRFDHICHNGVAHLLEAPIIPNKWWIHTCHG